MNSQFESHKISVEEITPPKGDKFEPKSGQSLGSGSSFKGRKKMGVGTGLFSFNPLKQIIRKVGGGVTEIKKMTEGAVSRIGKVTGVTDIFKRKNKESLSKRETEILVVKGHMKRLDIVAALISVAMSALSFTENEEFYKEIKNAKGDIIKARNVLTDFIIAMRFVVMFMTFALRFFS